MLMQSADTNVLPRLAHPVSGGMQGTGGSVNDGTNDSSGIGDLIFGQLLCSRLCHDLIGPTAAINAGEELIRDGDDGAEARDLIADSARQLTARLSFFRALFSPEGSTAGTSVRDARALVEGFLLGSRVSLDWDLAWDLDREAGSADDHPLGGDPVRLLLGLAMLASDALPRGGVVRIRLHRHRGEICIDVQASGATVRLESAVLQALQCPDARGVTARTIHAVHLSQLVRRTCAVFSIHMSAGQCLHANLKVPAEQATLAA